MLLVILWGLVTTLAVGQGLLVLFLIRSRGHALSQAAEILKLQDAFRNLAAKQAETTALGIRVRKVEELVYAPEEKEDNNEGGQLIRLAAVGGMR